MGCRSMYRSPPPCLHEHRDEESADSPSWHDLTYCKPNSPLPEHLHWVNPVCGRRICFWVLQNFSSTGKPSAEPSCRTPGSAEFWGGGGSLGPVFGFPPSVPRLVWREVEVKLMLGQRSQLGHLDTFFMQSGHREDGSRFGNVLLSHGSESLAGLQ